MFGNFPAVGLKKVKRLSHANYLVFEYSSDVTLQHVHIAVTSVMLKSRSDGDQFSDLRMIAVSFRECIEQCIPDHLVFGHALSITVVCLAGNHQRCLSTLIALVNISPAFQEQTCQSQTAKINGL